MAASYAQALPHAVPEHEAGVEHGHHRPVAGEQVAVDPDEDGGVARVVGVVVGPVCHGHQPSTPAAPAGPRRERWWVARHTDIGYRSVTPGSPFDIRYRRGL